MGRPIRENKATKKRRKERGMGEIGLIGVRTSPSPRANEEEEGSWV